MAHVTTKPKAVRPGAFLAQLIQMDQGVVANLPAGLVIPMEGAVQNQAQIHAMLQNWIAKFKAPEAAKQAYQGAVSKRLASTIEARTFYKGLKSVIKHQFGPQSPLLASFGIPIDKPIEMTQKQKLVAVAKRQQTRQLRGTKGKKQKAAITVVGQPALHLGSDGTLSVDAPPLNVAPPTSGPQAPGDATGNPGSTPATE